MENATLGWTLILGASFTSTVWELSFKTGTPCIGHYCKVALLSGHPSRSSRQPLNVDTL